MRQLCILLFLAATACGPSAQEIQSQFQERVDQSQACETASDCSLIYPGCPLGCYVAVRADLADELSAYAAQLISDYESGGVSCAYGCAEPGELVCSESACALVSD